MTVDVILPNYNKKEYITECLNSLVRQTDRDWHCLVIDGFSEDGSWEIIQDFAARDSRFELLQLPKTGNVYQAWNFGLKKVTNPYFCILTSDDLWKPQWLEIAIQSLKHNPSAVCAAARTRDIDEASNWLKIADFNWLGERFFANDDSTPQLRNGIVSSMASYFIGPIYTSIHSLVMRRELLEAGMQFADDVGSTADYEWYIRLGLHGDAIYHPEVEVGWRSYEGQATKPRNQEENGAFLQKIHRRTREEIVRRLDGMGDRFRIMADKYDRSILAYHFSRPYLVNLRYKPAQEFPRLLKILSTMPKEFILDFAYKAAKKNFYFEESLATAQRFYRKSFS
jgi:glycosyltransferase involved in cell wall biosynthesis